MALASFCGNFMQRFPIHPGFTGFIVDHKLRADSGDEAFQVAEELHRLNIKPCVLQLDWQAHGDPRSLTNFESVARQLRYQALGRACFAEGIQSMFAAHHADDQTETVLLRIIGGYTGTGLQGIRSEAQIPDCNGMYGVDGSGESRTPLSIEKITNLQRPGMDIEYGGVTLFRPLLGFTKDQLIATCLASGVKWFEDPTNSNPSLTIRNTLRLLQKQNDLPSALRRERLHDLAESSQRRQEDFEEQATGFSDQIDTALDLRVGKLTCTYDPGLITSTTPSEKSYHIQAVWLRRMLRLISPKINIPLRDLNRAVEVAIPQEHNGLAKTTVAGVCIQREHLKSRGDVILTMHREPPSRRDSHDMNLAFAPVSEPNHAIDKPIWTDWHFWDKRYWIRAGYVGPHSSTDPEHVVRFLTPGDIGSLRKRLEGQPLSDFEHALSTMPTKLRLTLPAIVEMEANKENVVALPSLAWPAIGRTKDHKTQGQGEWIWEIRYKQIDTESINQLKITC